MTISSAVVTLSRRGCGQLQGAADPRGEGKMGGAQGRPSRRPILCPALRTVQHKLTRNCYARVAARSNGRTIIRRLFFLAFALPQRRSRAPGIYRACSQTNGAY